MTRGPVSGFHLGVKRWWTTIALTKVVSRTVVAALLLSASATAVQLVSVADEIAIGRQAQVEVKKETPQVTDAAVRAYVARIGGTLAAHAVGERYPYSFSIADYREINAFALPGGPVWVNRGAIQAAGSESQLAGVLAHEIAHISRRHAAQQLSNAIVTNLGLGFLGALLGNAGGAAAANVAARSVASGAFLRFSRDDEQDADRVGVGIMKRAGWDPHGMIELMESIRQQEKRDPGSVETFFSNHPSPKDRVALLSAVVPARRSGTRDSAAFQSIRAKLRKLPAAKSMMMLKKK
jgi:predicted Zn-dependent protease